MVTKLRDDILSAYLNNTQGTIQFEVIVSQPISAKKIGFGHETLSKIPNF